MENNRTLTYKLHLSKFFPYKTIYCYRFLEVLSLVFPFEEYEIERFKDNMYFAFLLQNPNINLTKEFLIKYKKHIDYPLLLKRSDILWDIELLECYNINSEIEIENFNLTYKEYEYLINEKGLQIFLDESRIKVCAADLETISDDSYYWETLISKNIYLNFTVELMEKYKDKLCWTELSKNEAINWDSEKIIAFSDKIWWRGLCKNKNVKWNNYIVNRFRKKIDWSFVFVEIACRYINENTFFSMYKDELESAYTNTEQQKYFKKNEESYLLESFESYMSSLGVTLYNPNDQVFELNENKSDYGNVLKSLINVELKLNMWDIINYYKENCEAINFSLLSSSHQVEWSEELLVEFREFWHWNSILKNSSIYKDESLILEFADEIGWSHLSSYYGIRWDYEKIMKYQHRLDFTKLSSNRNVKWSYDLFIKFRDNWILDLDYCYQYEYEETYKNGIKCYYPTSFFEDFIFKYFSKEEIFTWIEGIPEINKDKNETSVSSKMNDIISGVRYANMSIKSKVYDTDVCKFGKYKGLMFSDIANMDKKFIFWCIENLDFFLLDDKFLREIVNNDYFIYGQLDSDDNKYVQDIIKFNKFKYYYYREDFENINYEQEILESVFNGNKDLYQKWLNS